MPLPINPNPNPPAAQAQASKQKAIYPADSILEDFIVLARTISEAADCFLLGSILPVSAAILSRGVWFPWAPRSLYPNLFSILCAKPGDRKSSTINLAENLAKVFLPIEAFLPKAFSPEALFDEYDVNSGGREDKLLIADDANALLTDWHRSANGERNATRFLDLYDCKDLTEAFRRNRPKNQSGPIRRVIPQTSTSVILGATPNIARFQNQTVQAGLQRRFLYYVAEELERTINCPRVDINQFNIVCQKFKTLNRLSGVFKFGPKAEELFTFFQASNRATRNQSDSFDEALLSRLATAPTSVLKIAMIFEACRSAYIGSNDLILQPSTLQLAIDHVEQCSETKRHRAHGAALAQARNEEGGNGSEKQEQETEVIDIEDIVAEGSDPAATYRRVQELEKVLYKRGIRALREGKQSQISIRLADYQRVLEMVRKLSAGVAALERDADKLVPRETAETIAAISPRVFRLGIMSWFSHHFQEVLELHSDKLAAKKSGMKSMEEAIDSIAKRFLEANEALPAWVIPIFHQEFRLE